MKRNSPHSTPDRSTEASRPGALVVLGLDPGTLVTGYGVVARAAGRLTMVACGTITNPAGHSMPLRLQHIYDELTLLLATHRPDEFAIESAFYGKNAQSALKLGHARGVSILAAVQRNIPTTEYSPREVKKALVGNGTASKTQVRFMVKSLLGMTGGIMRLDASDGLAIAICHLHRLATPAARHRDWKTYVEAHPEKVVR